MITVESGRTGKHAKSPYMPQKPPTSSTTKPPSNSTTKPPSNSTTQPPRNKDGFDTKYGPNFGQGPYDQMYNPGMPKTYPGGGLNGPGSDWFSGVSGPYRNPIFPYPGGNMGQNPYPGMPYPGMPQMPDYGSQIGQLQDMINQVISRDPWEGFFDKLQKWQAEQEKKRKEEEGKFDWNNVLYGGAFPGNGFGRGLGGGFGNFGTGLGGGSGNGGMGMGGFPFFGMF